MGILVVFSSSVLPLVKLPQILTKTGPSFILTESNQYWIDTFIIPTIDNDTMILITLKGGHVGGIGISIIPYKDGTPIVGETPVINYIFDADQETYTTQAKTNLKAEYFVTVFCIKNNYTLTINSVWSPYDSLRAYLYLGLSTLPAGLLIIYYDRIIEERDIEIQKALNK
jgi:hypothetical protein